MRFLFTAVLWIVCSLGGSAKAQSPSEEQGHGYAFEQWAHRELFGGFKPTGYTDKWDLPAGVSTRFEGLPVSIKAARLGRPIDMGDALRQFNLSEDFVLLIGFWVQEGDEKRFVKIAAPRISHQKWHALWDPIRREDLERFDALVKNRQLDYREARNLAKVMNAESPFKDAKMKLHAKIDGKGQRRLQCGLPFDVLFSEFMPGQSKEAEPAPAIDGVPGPMPVKSGPRFAPSPTP